MLPNEQLELCEWMNGNQTTVIGGFRRKDCANTLQLQYWC